VVSEPSLKLKATTAVEALNALTGQDDPESDHSKADTILLATVPHAVREAYLELVKRSKWWASA
jgi:hypothetical protein